MKKLIRIIISMILLTSVLVCMVSCDLKNITAAEKCAIKFVESIYEGDAQKYVDLIFDSVLAQEMVHEGYETEEMYVYALDKILDRLIEEERSDYGKRWKYKVSVIDSYSVTPSEFFSGYEVNEVFLKVEHSGRKLLFFKVSDFEEIKVQVIKEGNNWYVIDWSNVIV